MQSLKGIFYRLFAGKRCACCGQSVEQYLPLPEYYPEMYKKAKMIPWRSEMLHAEEYSCPHCFAADRERAYALWMLRELPRNGEFFLLDIAPAEPLGSFIRRAFPNAIYKTGDLFMEDVDYRLDIMDMQSIPDASFDFFICSHVLEHVPDDRRAMRELARILKPSGCGILVVPMDLNQQQTDEDADCCDVMERWRRFGQDDHIRKYAKTDFLQRIRESGLTVQEYNAEYFGSRGVWENSLSSTAVVYIVRRT